MINENIFLYICIYCIVNNNIMKYTKYLFLLFIYLFLNACSDDKKVTPPPGGKDDEERPETLAWIEDTMRENYYWYNEIPAESKLDYKLGEEKFFNSLLTKKDGRTINGTHYPYSYIENTAGNSRSTIRENLSYGIEFTGVYIGEEEIGILVLYVVPGSPADDENTKLKRGDWILKVDGAVITEEVYASMQGTAKARTLTVARWDSDTRDYADVRNNVPLAAARAVVDNPVYTYDVITRDNTSIGYLLYNHFTGGTDDKDKSYDNELRTLSSSLFNGVDEFILDLRYNNGGLITSAVLLCTILCPEINLNSKICSLKFNNKKQSSNLDYAVDKARLNPGGKNLNLKRLYVLTSSSSASASEMIINSLRSFMDVIVIGDQTVGKNVGSVTYPNDDSPYPYGTTTWSMHPIVCQISNKDGFTDYASGFKPGTYKKGEGIPAADEKLYIDEAFDYQVINGQTYAVRTEILPLGDPNERMLKAALDMIAPDKDQKTRSTASTISTKAYKKVPFNSIDRKATNGVIIDN